MKELDAVTVAARKAVNEWEARFVFDQSAEGPAGDKEYVSYLLRIAYLTIQCFLEKHGFNLIAEHLKEKWRSSEKDLFSSYMSDYVDQPMLRVADNFWEVIASVKNVVSASATTGYHKIDVRITNILEAIPGSAHLLKYSIQNEMDIDRFAESLLLPLYPDLNSSPSLTLADSYRQPDSALPSIKTLVEYKLITTKEARSKVVDEMQADIRNYYQSPWEHLVFGVGQSEPFLTKERLEGVLLAEPTSFKSIEIALFKI